MPPRKKNPMLAQIEARHEREKSALRLFCVQQSKDMMLLAANRAFGFGPERAKQLADAFDAVWREFATMTVEDAKDDKEIWYAKDKLDAALRSVCGDYFVPWDERYL